MVATEHSLIIYIYSKSNTKENKTYNSMVKETLVELTVNEDDNTGVDIISFVEHPAIEVDFMYFREEKEHKFKTVDEDKRIVIGAAMLPNEKIIRYDADDKPYFVYFSEDTVKQCSELFLKRSNHHGTNVDHSDAVKSGVTVVESWIVTDPKNDKSSALGYKNIPVGAWFVSYKVDNDELWQKVKDGEVLGFSVEGLFTQTIEDNSSDTFESEIEDIMNSCLSRDEIKQALREKVEHL